MNENELTVQAFSGSREIRSINNEGEPIVLGTLEYRDYENDRRSRTMFFTPADREEKTYHLGTATGRFQLIDHYEVLAPMIDQGWQMQRAIYSRGGARLTAFLTTSEAYASWNDPFGWDGLDGAGKPLLFGVRVQNDIRPGHAVSLTAGYYRIICTNGMMVQSLNMGHFRQNHMHYNQAELESFSQLLSPRNPESFPRQSTVHLNPVVNWLNEHLSYAAAEDDHVRPARPALITKPLDYITGALGTNSSEQLCNILYDLKENESHFSMLDLVGAVTLLGRDEVGRPTPVYRKLEGLTESLVDLVELGGIKTDSDVQIRPHLN